MPKVGIAIAIVSSMQTATRETGINRISGPKFGPGCIRLMLSLRAALEQISHENTDFRYKLEKSVSNLKT